jgi:tetratricopeptide (TPR) repeat protein
MAAYAIGSAACCGLALLTWQRVPTWTGPVPFWSATVAGYPGYHFAERRLAQAYNDEKRYEDAMPRWRDLLSKSDPNDPNTAQDFSNYGVALREAGRVSDAIEQFEHATQIDPGFTHAHFQLGYTLYILGQIGAALQHLERAAELNRKDWQAATLLADIYTRSGDRERAYQYAGRAVAAYSYNPELQLAFAQAALRFGKRGEALTACEEALRLRRDWPEAQAELALLVATGPKPDWGRALKLADSAVRRTESRQPRPLLALAAAHAAAGRFEQAVDVATRAADAARSSSDRSLRDEIDRAVSLFRSKQPLTMP